MYQGYCVNMVQMKGLVYASANFSQSTHTKNRQYITDATATRDFKTLCLLFSPISILSI